MAKIPPRGTHIDDLICKKCFKKRKERKKKNCSESECWHKDKKEKDK